MTDVPADLPPEMPGQDPGSLPPPNDDLPGFTDPAAKPLGGEARGIE